MSSVPDVLPTRVSGGNLPSKELLERLTLYEELMKTYDERFLPWWRQFAKLIMVIGILSTLVGGLGVAYITSTYGEKNLIKTNTALTQEANNLRSQLAAEKQREADLEATNARLTKEESGYIGLLQAAQAQVKKLSSKLSKSNAKIALLQKEVDILTQLSDLTTKETVEP